MRTWLGASLVGLSEKVFELEYSWVRFAVWSGRWSCLVVDYAYKGYICGTHYTGAEYLARTPRLDQREEDLRG